jgi:hypothetical protein
MALDSFAQIFEQMPAVGNLDRMGQSLSDGFSIFTGAVSGHNFDRGMLREPLFDRLTVPFWQHIDGFTSLMVNNECAIAASFAKGPIIDPDNTRLFNRWRLQVMEQPQKR